MFERFILGINYWPRRRGLAMWKEWSSAEISQEFAQISEMGFQVVRIFLLWEDFQPGEEEISEMAISHFDEILDIARKQRLQLVPTFFVGNMSGEVWDPPWRKNRSPYQHPALLHCQVSLLQFFGKRYREEKTILFWDLSNEPDLACEAPSSKIAADWNRVLYQELKKADSFHPVTIGLHQGSVLEDNHFRPQELAPFNDFMCMHAYPIYTPLCPDSPDSLRSTYWAPFLCKLSAALGGKPALMEEFGVSSQLVSLEQQKRYFESVVFSLVANGASGLFPWCFSDFAEAQRKPYDTTPYEAGFGVTTVEGRIKPSGEVLMKLANILKKVALGSLEKEPVPAAILVPRRYHDNPEEKINPEIQTRALFNSFLLAKQAGFDVDLVTIDWELDSYRMIFMPVIPSRAAVTVSDWRRLFQYVSGGGLLYASYHGVAASELETIFGIKPQYAVEVMPGEISLSPAGLVNLPEEIRFETVRSKKLKLEEKGEVWVRDDRGEAALTFHAVGEGGAFFCSYPVELYLSYMPEVYRGSQAYQLYRCMAQKANIPASTTDGWPHLESKLFWNQERKYLLLINHQGKRTDVDLSERMKKIHFQDVLSGEMILSLYLSLGPNEARFLEIIGEEG